VWSQVGAQVGAQVRSQVRSQVENLRLLNFIYPYCAGQFDSGYFSWVDFMQDIGVTDIPKVVKYYSDTSKVGLIYPLENCVIVCQKPSIIKKNSNGLHCEDGPALVYNDGGVSEWYYLNGVRMTKEQVMTPAEKLQPKEILAETNVEVRRELIRKMGIELLLNYLPHKVLDKKGNYELLNVELSDECKSARYLKMQNPSVKCWHLEGVEGETVTQAINWRASQLKLSQDWIPSQLT
jgi:hypothetical protein